MLPEKRKADLRKELRTLVWLPLFVIVMCGFVIALEFHRHEWFGGSIQFIPIAVNVWVLR